MLLAKGPVLHTPSCFVNPGHKLAGGPAFRSLGRTQQNGCPTLRVLCEGWARCRMQRRFRHCPNPVLQTASYPPLPTTQGRGTHPYRSCRQLKGWATRHLPATVAVHPNSGYVCFAGHRVSATGGILRSVIHESGDIGAEELNMWIKKLDGRESAL